MTRKEVEIQYALGTLQWHKYTYNRRAHVYLSRHKTLCGHGGKPSIPGTSDYSKWFYKKYAPQLHLATHLTCNRCMNCQVSLDAKKAK